MGVLTDKQMGCKSAKRDLWLTEDAPRGAGRFVARITPSGERLFYFRYTAPNGTREWLSIGPYDPTGKAGFTLATAREKAKELSSIYQAGAKDLKGHLEQIRLDEIAQKEREEAQREAERVAAEADAAKEAARITVRGLFERWASVNLIRRKDGGAEIRRMFEKDVLPSLGAILVEDVRKGHITAVTDALLARGVTRMAKLIFSLIRQMFRFAVDRDIIEFEPTAAIRKVNIGGKDTERERVLDEDEIRVLVKQLPKAGLSDSAGTAVWLALSTCCRIGELMAVRWEHVNFDRRTWWIPPENSKNGKAHTVFLSDFALAQFQKLKDSSDNTAAHRARADGVEVPVFAWVYPNRTGTGAVCPKTITKQLGDRQRGGLPPMKGRARAELSGTLELVGGRWGPHDLRRTGATMMVKLGVLPEVAERCLNHTEENKVKRIYQRHSYESEMRQAWVLLGDRLELLLTGADNVVTGEFGKVA